MGLNEEIQKAVQTILGDSWTDRDGRVVPEPEDLALDNDAIKLKGTVLYADMSGSTKLVDGYSASFSAEVYKSYLISAAKIIKAEGGTITAYDGDRIMAVFLGDFKNSTAAKVALKISYAVLHIINPAIVSQYGDGYYSLSHVVGIDTSSLFAARIGVRNDNDIVWVGRAANYAAKLTAIGENNTTFITGAVFDALHDSSKYKKNGAERQLMWKEREWTQMSNLRVYSSNWTWGI